MNTGDRIALGVAVITAFGVIFAIYSSISESKRFRFAQSVELVLKMDDRFDSPLIQKVRTKAARSLLKKSTADLDDMLDFFETIGMLVRRGALDKEMAHEMFFPWIQGYYQAAHFYILSVRKNRSDIWEDLQYLYDETLKIEKQKCRCPDSILMLSETELKEFLVLEAKD
jgi:hypothetical protein